jgi:hypothetical protein
MGTPENTRKGVLGVTLGLRFMEYFLNSLEVSLYFSKERQ